MQKTLQKNIGTLQKINPALTEWLKKEKPSDWIQKIKSQNGDDNFLIESGSQFTPAYSMKNPVKEAKKAVKKMDLHKENISILLGIGLGYLANEILIKMEKGHKLIVIEPVADILKIALGKFNFVKYFENGSLLLVTPGGNDSIQNKLAFALHFLSNQSVIEAWPFTIELYTQKRPDEYKDLTKLTSDVLNQILCNTGTIAGAAGGIIADNDMRCMPYLIRHRGVAELKNLYKDKPAILVSTGPSLAKNIHHLINIQDKVIIICVGQALRVLLAYDIRPDFACTVDFGEVNYVHFKGLMDCGIPLVTINRTYAKLIKDWQGPKFVAATPVPGFEDMATGILTDKGFIEAGGSVAHLCFGLAQLLGCNPITFIGQDLALGKTSHIAQADAGGEVFVDKNGLIGWKVKDQRCHLFGDNLHGMGYVQYVSGYYGQAVMTNAGLMSFKTVFENMIERWEKENNIIINSTEGGCHIKGSKRISLKNVIKKYCQNPIDKSVITPLLSHADNADELIKKVIPLLKQDIDNLNEIIINSRKGIAVSHGIKTLMNRPEYNRLLPKKTEKMFNKLNQKAIQESQGNQLLVNQLFFKMAIDKLKKCRLKTMMIMSEKNFIFSENAHIAAVKNPLVNVAIYGATRQIATRGLKVDPTINHFLKNKKDAIIRTERNMIILNAAKTASESLKKSYRKTLKLLKKYDKTKDDNLLTSFEKEPINLKDAEDYFKAGNWAHPLLDAKKYMNQKECCGIKKYESAKRIYYKAIEMKDKAIYKAKEDEKEHHDKMIKLVKYNELLENAKDAGRLDKDFDQALELMKEAIELMPDEQEARWGLATALHHAQKIEESIKEYKKLIEDFPDNNTFRFEYGQVLLLENDLKEGLKQIGIVMEKTDEFDSFLSRLGEIYEHAGMDKEALVAYSAYLKKYPYDYKIWNKKGDCLTALNRKATAKKAYQKALDIKPD